MSAAVTPGRLIVFEGSDGVGKSTLSEAFVSAIRYIGIPCAFLSFPGKEKGTIGNLVYGIHHAATEYGISEITDASLQALHIAAHLDAIERNILPAIDKGHWVVLDRFWWSTWVYGRDMGVKESTLDALILAEQRHWNDVSPDALFLVDRSRDEVNNESHVNLRKGYQHLFDLEENKYPIYQIQNNSSLKDTLIQLFATISSLIPDELSKGLSELTAKLRAQSDWLPFLLSHKKTESVFTKLSPAQPTVVYDSYWRFATERQEVFFRKLEGHPPPWTDDPILSQYKFTNAYRASDRVSQFLIKHVIYEGDQSPVEVFFRTILFKLFNKIETWEMLRNQLTEIRQADYSFQKYDEVLTEALSSGIRIYSGAYIMPSGRSSFGHSQKHRNHLLLLERMIEDEVSLTISNVPSMSKVFELLRSYPTIGDFLAYQFATDLNYSNLTNFSEMEFVVPGPGALDGVRKCFSDYGGLNEADIIRVVTERQEQEFERLGLQFRTLGGRSLQLIDCQNVFCEISKYARVKHPEIKGYSDRTRIKQVYRPSENPITYWYPPKWCINHLIPHGGESV